MSIFRSQTMGCYQIVIPRQSAWQWASQTGQIQSIQVLQNPQIVNKPFQAQVKICEEALQKISDLQYQLKLANINSYLIKRAEQDYQKLLDRWSFKHAQKKRTAISMMEEIVEQIIQKWTFLLDINKKIQTADIEYIQVCQTIGILRASQNSLGKSFYESLHKRSFMWDEQNFKFKSGIIDIKDQLRFHKLVFRISKGNAHPIFVPLQSVFQSNMKQLQHKLVFFIIYPSQQTNYLESKLQRMIQNYAKIIVTLPTGLDDLTRQKFQLDLKVKQYKHLSDLLKNQKQGFLKKLGSSIDQQNTKLSKIQYLKAFMLKQRQIYNQLNNMNVFNNFIQGNIYFPQKDFDKVANTISKIQRKDTPTAQIIKQSQQKYPTLFQTNSFTKSAQQIVDTYGVPRYKQINPGIFTCITFPFLFGVMFGDIMHGAILFAFGLNLIFRTSRYQKHFLSILLPHRYLITLMGFFSFYCGFIYNDYLSIALNIFSSCYSPNLAQLGQQIPRKEGCVYPFGVDPVWSITSNGLTYMNSMKMKIAVIIGVIHMTFAVLLKASNAIYFKKWIDFFFEFIPQLIFMILLFGYMDFLIIYKWTFDWTGNTQNAPSIITTMINFPLGLGKTQDCCGAQPMWGSFGNTSQDSIQLCFLIISLICIPWMLLSKPLIEIYGNKLNSKSIQALSLLKNQDPMVSDMKRQESQIKIDLSLSKNKKQQHQSNEIFVHQMIQTIEYVLGCISNTASYLRLWALSLAHSQLAEVFFQKTVQSPIVDGFSGIPLMIINFVILAMATFGVLLCMDVMQCFLHALRLHWVQFQNKFYKADGFAFQRFSFKRIIINSIPQ